MRRMWINQPSMLQQLHPLHGIRVLAGPDTDLCSRAYFLSGRTVSMQIPHAALSEGWPELTRVGVPHIPEGPSTGVATDHIDAMLLSVRASNSIKEAMLGKGIDIRDMTLERLDELTDEDLRQPIACGKKTIGEIRAAADRYLGRTEALKERMARR